ncbi:MAG: RNA pseudouridine synthase [Puniceicoccaceae bacterium]|nr:MAG: RNA pseudouridine synthase [Puniceicoccaceae bacterium]
MKSSAPFLSLAEGILGPGRWVFPLLFDRGPLLALNKPPGVAVSQDPLSAEAPNLLTALQGELEREKPQLRRLGIEGIHRINPMDAEISGALLLARDKESGDRYRNALGSSLFRFTYRFLSDGAAPEDEVSCDLPLARHRLQPRMLISHGTGRKTVTRFRRIGQWGRFALWEAGSSDCRPHQVRVHAVECGIPVLGDSLYGRRPVPALSDLRRRGGPGRGGDGAPDRPLYDWPCLHLARIDFPACEEEGTWTVEAPLPSRLATLLKHLRQSGRAR